MILALAAGATTAPSAARAAAPDSGLVSPVCDQILGAEPVDPACMALRKVESGLAQLCRIVLGRDQPLCTTPTGIDVSAPAVQAGVDGWAGRALAHQRRLAADAPLGRSTWLSTHNAYNSAAYYPTLSRLDTNQHLSITDQLDLGIRNVELDLHWWPSLAKLLLQPAPIACHATAGIGCTVEAEVSVHLAEVRRWLDRNPGELVVIYLDDNLDEPAAYDAAAAQVRAAFGDLLHTPPGDGACHPMPLDLTPAAALAAGSQVLVRTHCRASATPAFAGIGFGSQGHLERGFGGTDFGPAPHCAGPWDEATRRGSYVRVYEDATLLSAVVDGGHRHLDAAATATLVDCGVDEVGFDLLVPHDPRLAAAVWSWAPTEPALEGPGRCAVATPGTDGRRSPAGGTFVAVDCAAGSLPALCARRAAGTWHLTAPTTAADARLACATAHPGSTFAVPRSGGEATEVRLLLASAEVDRAWLAYGTDPEGRWRPHPPTISF